MNGYRLSQIRDPTFGFSKPRFGPIHAILLYSQPVQPPLFHITEHQAV
jgi:hypothetical protein